MTFPKYYMVDTVFGLWGPIAVADLVKKYNALLDKMQFGPRFHLNSDSVREYLRQGNEAGHFRNLRFYEVNAPM